MKNRKSSLYHVLSFTILLLLFPSFLRAREIDVLPARYPLPVTTLAPPTPVDIASVIGQTSLGTGEMNARRILLLTTEIKTSTVPELVRRLSALQLETSGDIDTLKNRLFAYYGITESEMSFATLSEKSDYVLEILKADRMMAVRGSVPYVLLEGSVEIRFVLQSEEVPKALQAERILLDIENKRLSAMGNVIFRDEKGTTLQQVKGEIVTLYWGIGDIRISQGSTSMMRKNSDGDDVEFFTMGENVSYFGDQGSVLFEKGLITTNQENQYFSISAEKLLLIDGGDMFIKQAWISIGRVPLLWIPFLYYPGQTFIFNPAFGFDLDRGLFFSSTTEIYGTYDKIKKSDESSFTTLLSTGEVGKRIRDGWVYTSSPPDYDGGSSLEKWAASSGSYLTLLVDAYQNKGTFIGIDTLNNFNNKQYGFALTAGIGFSGNLVPSAGVYDIPPVRYLFDGLFTIKNSFANVSLTLPIYSDPKVKLDYANRLTAFSIGSLTGEQDFPDTFRSDITSYTWNLDGSFTIPVKSLNPYITNLKISRLSARANWKAIAKSANLGSGFTLSSTTIPDFNATMAGTLLSVKVPVTPMESVIPGQNTSVSNEKVDENSIPVIQESIWDYEEFGIEPIYPAPVAARSITPVAKQHFHTLNLAYTLNQAITNTYQLENLQSTSESLYAKTQGDITLSGAIAPNRFDFSQKFVPLLTFSDKDANQDLRYQIQSTTKSSIPFLGLSYTLSARIYTFNSETTASNPNPVQNEKWGSWDTDTISIHQLAITNPIALGQGTLTTSLTGVLPPLKISLTPRIQYRLGKSNTSLSYKLIDNGSGGLDGELITGAFTYNDPNGISFSIQSLYDTSYLFNNPAPNFSWDPFSTKASGTVRFFNKYVQISQKLDYVAKTNTFNSLESSISFPWMSVSLLSAGTIGQVKPKSMNISTQINGYSKYWWKNRINLGLDLLSTFHYNFSDATSTNLRITAGISFSIAEFLSLKISLTSVNKGFYQYADFSSILQDLMKSFDFFGTGRMSTQFNMESVSFELIHYMDDWNLHCKYTGSVVLSNMEWIWSPVFTIFLQWKSIPELKVDKRFDL